MNAALLYVARTCHSGRRDCGRRRAATRNRNVTGVFEMALDATLHYAAPLTATRLFGWHAALIPTGYNGLTRIRVGAGTNAGDAAFAISA